MVETIEDFYINLLGELNEIKVPNSFKSPSGSLFVDKFSATNDINQVFSIINKISFGLGQKGFDYSECILRIRNERTTREDLVILLSEMNALFQEKRGKLINLIRTKLEELRE